MRGIKGTLIVTALLVTAVAISACRHDRHAKMGLTMADPAPAQAQIKR